MDEQVDDIAFDLGNIDVETTAKRETCDRCMRPATVCWCPYLPRERIETRSTIYILQHPYEEKRRLKTAPMLKHCLTEGKCHIYPGNRFPLHKYKELERVTKHENTLLLFPSADAVDLNDYLESLENPYDRNYNIILLDGTWLMARGIFFKNLYLQKLKQVRLKHDRLSEYVIRTQPTENSLSTLETAAITISMLENKPGFYEMFVRPLRALCEFQMAHGAVVHQSKEYLIENGLYKKQGLKPGDGIKQKKRSRRKQKGDVVDEESL